MHRKHQAILALVAAMLLGGRAAAAEYTFAFAHSVGEESTQQVAATALKRYLEEASGGRIAVNIFPNAQLGADREQIEGVQEGSITMMTSSPAPQVNFVAAAAIFDLPFGHATVADIDKTHNSPVVIAALQEEYAKKGLQMLGVSNLGFRITSANRAVHAPEDLRGFTIRTMENQYHILLWRSLGANPTPIAMNEVYTSLQQGVVDGQENPMELIYITKFYEQQSHVIKTNHLPHTLVWLMNKEIYDDLPEDLQQIVDDGVQVARKAGSEYIFSQNDEYEARLKELGTTIIELDAEGLKPFRKAVQPVWDLLQKNVPAAVYDAYVGALE
ncbi:MAG: TRAP transporter substrate-binding protein [Planctomycetes bacterium]|nr:TRAP transporter substrate-binding protein [Planctomycetota bacterium]